MVTVELNSRLNLAPFVGDLAQPLTTMRVKDPQLQNGSNIRNSESRPRRNADTPSIVCRYGTSQCLTK